MSLFQRVLRFLSLLAGLAAGAAVAIAALITKRLITPPRQPLWATPGDLGLKFENVQFPAQDGVRLSGWFVPAADGRRKGATLVLVHGWTWNRLGDAADDALSNLSGATPVDLLRLAFSLQQDGFHVFMFDLRNHGESAALPPFTFGQLEAHDLLGALDYLANRAEVAADRIGVVAFSAGANALLYALPQTSLVQAGVAVQPTTPAIFSRRYATYLFGPAGGAMAGLVDAMYQRAGGVKMSAFQPSFAAAGIHDAPVLFVQGKGDDWGSMEDVVRIAAATPEPQGPLFVDSTHRYGGYQYVVDNPKILTAFFTEHLPE
ncbi:MAG: alpha/beta fold hydrolase [Anaerolineales bacterium]|nr:alpha/beta fold hydrolase [Anaerolineales bacterium]